jgi:hypothetical protein
MGETFPFGVTTIFGIITFSHGIDGAALTDPSALAAEIPGIVYGSAAFGLVM